jgi:hypothetical protein
MEDTDDFTENEAPAENHLDIHDVEVLKKLWFMIKATLNQEELFGLMKILIDSLPYDWIDKNENWLLLAQQLDQFGESELASLFKLANQRAFQMSLKG